MARLANLLDRGLHRVSMAYWRWRHGQTAGLPLSELRALRRRARAVRRITGRITHDADMRLILPVIGSRAMDLPDRTTWAHRPGLWSAPISPAGICPALDGTELGDDVRLFHDCKDTELTVRQVRNTDETDMAAFGLALDVFSFDGSFLSLAVEMPDAAWKGLDRSELVHLDVRIEAESKIEVFTRINLRHGPNVDQAVREIDMAARVKQVEFDMYYTGIEPDRLNGMWLDLILENPSMNRVVIKDVVVARRPRAAV